MDYDLVFSRGMEISINAGKAIMDIYNSEEFDIRTKSDNSPLTAADLASHRIIVDGLELLNRETGVDIPVLSEESAEIPYGERRTWSRYWLIDPLDGTKEFIKRNGEFTVNVALIEEGVPVLGFVYVPVLDELYYGNLVEKKALKITGASKNDIAQITEINVTGTLGDTVRIIASKSHLNEDTRSVIDAVKAEFGNCEFLSSGSSLKLCRVAEGFADLYPRYAPTMEWDTAAADAVCRAAGCFVMDAGNHKPVQYNKENLLNPFFYVTANNKIQSILEKL